MNFFIAFHPGEGGGSCCNTWKFVINKSYLPAAQTGVVVAALVVVVCG